MTWMQRLKRVFAIDIETCPNCGGKLKVIASIEDPDVIAARLRHSRRALTPIQNTCKKDPLKFLSSMGSIRGCSVAAEIVREGGEMKLRLTALLCAGLASFAVGADDGLKAAIQARENEWAAAFNAGDAKAVSMIYGEDAVLVPPGSEPVRGREAIAAALANFFPIIDDLALVADEVRPLGDRHAVEIGHSEYMSIGTDGARTPAIDNYVVVWHKGDDGVWRYVSDIFNSR